MSWTTSPGSSRGSENTITDAISSDGIATRSRRSTYFFTKLDGLPRLLVQPGGHQAPAVVVADIGPEVLDVRHPRRHRAHRGAVGVVDLLGDEALDVVDDLAPFLLVERPPLELDHLGELGIVHPDGIERLAGQQLSEIGIGVGGAAAEGEYHLVEL